MAVAAGVWDFFMDQKLFCERVIGVSAGAVRLQLRGRRTGSTLPQHEVLRRLALSVHESCVHRQRARVRLRQIPNRLERADTPPEFDQSPMQRCRLTSPARRTTGNLYSAEPLIGRFALSMAIRN